MAHDRLTQTLAQKWGIKEKRSLSKEASLINLTNLRHLIARKSVLCQPAATVPLKNFLALRAFQAVNFELSHTPSSVL